MLNLFLSNKYHYHFYGTTVRNISREVNNSLLINSQLKGSVQRCVKFEINVFRKEAVNVLKIGHIYKNLQLAK